MSMVVFEKEIPPRIINEIWRLAKDYTGAILKTPKRA